MSRTLSLRFDDLLPYQEGVELQQRLVRARQQDKMPDVVLLLQHHPVVTLGRRGRDQYLRLTKEEYTARGIELYTSSRGGDVTYHGPGQWVLYPILKLGGRDADAHGYLNNLEEIAIRTCRSFGIEAWRREGKNGAWTEQGKIAAIGFHLKRWVSMHGMSFNVQVDLSGFETIVPCGLAGEPVSSLQQLLPDETPGMDDAATHLLDIFSEVMDRPLTPCTDIEEHPALASCFEGIKSRPAS